MGMFLTRYLPALIWAGLIAAALLMPGDSLDEAGVWFEIPEWLMPWAEMLSPWADKLVHFVLFLVLAFLAHRCFRLSMGEWGASIRTLGATLPYIFVLEAAQIWIPDRGWESLDVAAGIGGVLVALLLIQLFQAWHAA